MSDDVTTVPDDSDLFATPTDPPEPEPAEEVVSEELVVDEVVPEELVVDELAEIPPEDSPFTRPGRWYVVHTQSGYEKKAKSNLEARIGSMNLEDEVFEVVIPTEDVVEFKNGKKQVVQKKVFPGYLLVRCFDTPPAWECIRNTPLITGFVGAPRVQGSRRPPRAAPRPPGGRSTPSSWSSPGSAGGPQSNPSPASSTRKARA